jgi:hypothetical protein
MQRECDVSELFLQAENLFDRVMADRHALNPFFAVIYFGLHYKRILMADEFLDQLVTLITLIPTFPSFTDFTYLVEFAGMIDFVPSSDWMTFLSSTKTDIQVLMNVFNKHGSGEQLRANGSQYPIVRAVTVLLICPEPFPAMFRSRLQIDHRTARLDAITEVMIHCIDSSPQLAFAFFPNCELWLEPLLFDLDPEIRLSAIYLCAFLIRDEAFRPWAKTDTLDDVFFPAAMFSWHCVSVSECARRAELTLTALMRLESVLSSKLIHMCPFDDHFCDQYLQLCELLRTITEAVDLTPLGVIFDRVVTCSSRPFGCSATKLLELIVY